jgi:hypothetical protein
MIPALRRAGFKPDKAVAIVSAASAMGILVPPCLLMVVIAQIAGLSVGAMFLAGFIPAAVLALAIMALIYVQARREGIGGVRRATLADLTHAFREAVIPMMMPVIIFGAILGGIADPTEAAVLAVIYAFIVGVFVYKEVTWQQLPKILVDSAVTSGIVIFMVGTASSFSWLLAVQQVPAQLADAMLALGAVGLLRVSIVIHRAGAILETARRHHLSADLPADHPAPRDRPDALLGRGCCRDRPGIVPAAGGRRSLHRQLLRRVARRADDPRDAALCARTVHGDPNSHRISVAHADCSETVPGPIGLEPRGRERHV